MKEQFLGDGNVASILFRVEWELLAERGCKSGRGGIIFNVFFQEVRQLINVGGLDQRAGQRKFANGSHEENLANLVEVFTGGGREYRIGKINRDVNFALNFIQQIAERQQVIGACADDGERIQIVADDICQDAVKKLAAGDFFLRQQHVTRIQPDVADVKHDECA